MSRRSSSDLLEVPAARLRIDKWLWAARFFKTRGLAQAAVEVGRVRIVSANANTNTVGERVKPSREVRLADVLQIQVGDLTWQISVCGLSEQRGPAPQARQLYAESAESEAARLAQIETRRANFEPGSSIKGRPTKKDRRLIHRFTE